MAQEILKTLYNKMCVDFTNFLPTKNAFEATIQP